MTDNNVFLSVPSCFCRAFQQSMQEYSSHTSLEQNVYLIKNTEVHFAVIFVYLNL